MVKRKANEAVKLRRSNSRRVWEMGTCSLFFFRGTQTETSLKDGFENLPENTTPFWNPASC